MSARQNVERGAPPEIAENALLAAIVAFGEIGQATRVGQVYGELAALDLEPARTRALRARGEALREGEGPAARDRDRRAPSLARGTAHLNEVWRVDVLEWEQAGSASEACADVMLDRRCPEFMRRRAMLARLTAIEAERPGGRPERRVRAAPRAARGRARAGAALRRPLAAGAPVHVARSGG